MLWNLLGLQRKLDALFDEGWIRLGIGSGDASHLQATPDETEDSLEWCRLRGDTPLQPLTAT